MITYRRWAERATRWRGKLGNWDCDGWFLFGFIPLYVRRVELIRS